MSVFELPIGSVIAYGGSGSAEDVPPGWLLCDGEQYSQDDYPELFRVIENRFGWVPPIMFRVPDLRGRFVRGALEGVTDDEILKRDPGREARSAMNEGGSTKNRVGSIQGSASPTMNEIEVDRVKTPNFTSRAPGTINANGSTVGISRSTSSGSLWNSLSFHIRGDETRPINAYLHYIIKACSDQELRR